MAAAQQCLAYCFQRSTHSLLDGEAFDLEEALLVLTTDVSKTKKVKRLEFAFTVLETVFGGVPPKPYQSGFGNIQFQSELTKAFRECLQELPGF